MEKVAEMLRGVFYFATVDGDQPRVRAFDSCVDYNGKIYFETTNVKDVCRQIVANPKFELFAMGDWGVLRLTGEAFEEKDADTVRAVEEKIGKYLGDPNLAIFRMERVLARITNPDGSEERLEF